MVVSFMAKSKNNAKKVSYISVPSEIITSLSPSSLQSLLLSPKELPRSKLLGLNKYKSPKICFFALFLFGFLGMLKLWFKLETLVPFPPHPPCVTSYPQETFFYNELSNGQEDEKDWLIPEVAIGSNGGKSGEFDSKDESFMDSVKSQDLISNGHEELGGEGEGNEFWEQPDGLGYRPCLEFSRKYMKESEVVVEERKKYLLVVVSGGMNQQRNQIVDAVVIARILGAALVVPILQVNVIWRDESEFSDIFDLENFKRVLADDVRIVSSLPSTHIRIRPMVEKLTQLHISPQWIRSRYLRRLSSEGVLLLRGLESRLSKDLPSDLQKLCCKVAFHALRFASPILELGNKLADRMRSKGPYLALHLRMEKDVWIRTGCLPGLTTKYDDMIHNERKRRPELLTSRSNMTYHERKLAGLCPLNALEVTRLLKALGAPKNARMFWAGGQPFGGKEALLPLTREFPHFYNKEDLALPGELDPFANRASFMAAVDYIVSEKSDVFMASHGGNMGHAIQGHRAYAGHKKYITPNKRHMLPYFLNSSLQEEEFNRIIKELHHDSLGQPEIRTSKSGRDVTKFPIPECMCNDTQVHSSL